MKQLDMFGAQLPALNIAGEGRVTTLFGGCMSLLIFYVTFLFASLKLSVMLERKQPSIVTNIDKTAFTEGETINT